MTTYTTKARGEGARWGLVEDTSPMTLQRDPRATVTIRRGNYGTWYARLQPLNGYPVEKAIEDVNLVALVAADWAIIDPEHWIDLYGPESLREQHTSVTELDADSAGYGWHSVVAEGYDYGEDGEW